MDFATLITAFGSTEYEQIDERINQLSAHVTQSTYPDGLVHIIGVIQILHVSKDIIGVLNLLATTFCVLESRSCPQIIVER